jgi:hypothetical protein
MTEGLETPSAHDLLLHFNVVLGVAFVAPIDLLNAAQAAIDGCAGWPMYGVDERARRLMALVNSKLRLNKERLQYFLDEAARSRIFMNYHDKIELLECLDHRNEGRLQEWLLRGGYDPKLLSLFKPIAVEESLSGLRQLLSTGTVNRSDARQCSLSERQNEILRSLYGSYVFHAFPSRAMHCHFNPDCVTQYNEDFYHHLRRFHPATIHRDCSMIFLCIDQDLMREGSQDEMRDALYAFIRTTYDRLANHCFLAIQIKPLRDGDEDGQWRVYSDLILYAEKHREVRLRAGYFRPTDIEAATCTHIAGLRSEDVRFDLANEGFFFRDCLVLSQSGIQEERGQSASSEPVDLLLLFEKNERDESIIPCPACRSRAVAGNSYPTLGVRSWECQNPICPDRSAFDRGNRYSLSAIIKQEAIKSDADQIPDWSLKRWKLDVVLGIDDSAVVDMLIRHFSLHGDTVVIVNRAKSADVIHGRHISYEQFEAAQRSGGNMAHSRVLHFSSVT